MNNFLPTFASFIWLLTSAIKWVCQLDHSGCIAVVVRHWSEKGKLILMYYRTVSCDCKKMIWSIYNGLDLRNVNAMRWWEGGTQFSHLESAAHCSHLCVNPISKRQRFNTNDKIMHPLFRWEAGPGFEMIHGNKNHITQLQETCHFGLFLGNQINWWGAHKSFTIQRLFCSNIAFQLEVLHLPVTIICERRKKKLYFFEGQNGLHVKSHLWWER